jgi:glycosyltransferase involved in cell wall biosynthesis
VLNHKTVAVVVPCYNEEQQITRVLRTMPEFVDLIIVVNDKSRDGTVDKVKAFMVSENREPTRILPRTMDYSDDIYSQANNIAIDLRKAEEKLFIPVEITQAERSRVVLLSHQRNGGKGATVSSGYKYARDRGIDCTAIMDGDGQMNPAELERICMPVVTGVADYSKGNRFKHRTVRQSMPQVRYYGNAILSILTKIATGYWRVSDTQTGFTAISLEAMDNIAIHKLFPSYGVYNDLLQKLNLADFTVTEVPITPVYNIGEKSKMRIFRVMPRISGLLIRLFFDRLFRKYLFTSFHPLFLLYIVSFFTFLIDIPIAVRFLHAYLVSGDIWTAHLTILTTLMIFSFQSLVFAMWFDMHDNERLYV